MKYVLDGLEKTLNAILTQARKEKTVGPIKCKFSCGGNVEMYNNEFEQIAKEECQAMGFKFASIFVLHDDDNGKGFTRITVTCYDLETIVDYIDLLVKRDLVRGNPRQMLNTLSKCMTIADDFNNRFGEGKYSKTKELNEIQEIFELMKDITEN